MAILMCANCGYEVDEVDELDFCQTCRNAYEAGYLSGRGGVNK
jgi:hypothetical protein